MHMAVFVDSLVKDMCNVNTLITSAVLNLFRLADHLSNFVAVRGPPNKFLHFLGKISEFLTTFFSNFDLNSFSARGPTQKNSPIFQISLIFQGQGQKNHYNFICNLVVTQSMKRCQLRFPVFVRNKPERRWSQRLLKLFLFSHRNDTS